MYKLTHNSQGELISPADVTIFSCNENDVQAYQSGLTYGNGKITYCSMPWATKQHQQENDKKSNVKNEHSFFDKDKRNDSSAKKTTHYASLN